MEKFAVERHGQRNSNVKLRVSTESSTPLVGNVPINKVCVNVLEIRNNFLKLSFHVSLLSCNSLIRNIKKAYQILSGIIFKTIFSK